MDKTSTRADEIPPFHVMDILARAKQLEAEGRSVIHLEVGEPDFPTPQPVIDAGIRVLQDQKTHYTPACGLVELRQAIADFYQRRFGLEVSARRIIVTPGASGALQLALSVLSHAGDQVLLPQPGYPCNRNIAKVLGLGVKDVIVDAHSAYQLLAEDIEEHWDEKTCAAMVSTPSNPTGTMISEENMSALLHAVKEKNGALIVDEIYQGLVYDGETYTALSHSDDVFVINSFSKYFGMTGWRIGWMVVPQRYVDGIDRIAQNIFLAPPTISQHAALEAFSTQTIEILESRVDEFRRRRDYLLSALPALGFKIDAVPEGAFYIYADCSTLTDDSQSWTRDLLESQGVALTPGIDFGDHGAATHVRFAYTRPIRVLEEAIDRIRTFIND